MKYFRIFLMGRVSIKKAEIRTIKGNKNKFNIIKVPARPPLNIPNNLLWTVITDNNVKQFLIHALNPLIDHEKSGWQLACELSLVFSH